MRPIDQLHLYGQSIWYDNIQRSMLENGRMANLISDRDIRGVTSNPAIFNNAIARSNDYDAALVPMSWAGWTAEQIFNQLALEDIRAAADLFADLYHDTQGGDGYVSLEVSPILAHDTDGTLAEARRLWKVVDRPNLMVKIPATLEGLPAIREAIADGININVTLIFSLERYAAVMEAYLTGLEKRSAAGMPLGHVASVASFFVSRVDTKIDAKLQELSRGEGKTGEEAAELFGKAAIANAKLAYAAFQEVFQTKRFEVLKEKGAHVQRPLWASTSTKNPNYRDVIYVEELIGADTVNTMPPPTLDAFRDHGRARLSIIEDLDGAREQLLRLEALGISMAQVTHELEVEGVQAFADAYRALMKTIDERRTAAAAELGSLQTAVSLRVAEMERSGFARRFFEHDARLWTQDPGGQEEIRMRMGWIEAPVISRALLPQLEDFVKEVHAEGLTHAVLLGMGGSSLAPEVTRLVSGVGEGGLDLLILDSTDPGQVAATLAWSPLEKTLYIVSSKSGETAEVNAFFEYFWAEAEKRLGVKGKLHFIAVADPGTKLDKQARELKFHAVFNADSNVGGRNSALTAFGLVPAALMGVDPNQFLGRAEWMARQCAVTIPAGRNPGFVLGAVLGEGARSGRDKVTFVADSLWSPLGAWLEQLIAESSGKEGMGILPVENEPAADTYANDRLFVYLRSSGEKDALAATMRSSGHPVLTIQASDPGDLSAEFYRWMVATAVACAVLGVNSFNQPDVQDAKDRTVRKMNEFTAAGKFDEGLPIWESSGASVFGTSFPGLKPGMNLKDLIENFLSAAKEGDYVAINAYVPRNPVNIAKLQSLRERVISLTGLATTLGFGPRFLHSTGQLHKGGPNTGLFLQITSEPEVDLDIPNQGISFATLERGQALGDLEALQARGRRVIRVHLKGTALEDLL
jgi:transaldolase / glucose-6-phosphate isomerase